MPRETVRTNLVVDDMAKYLVDFRFFEAESIVVIAMIMLRYKVEVKEEPEFIGETFEQRYARITASNLYVTNT